jgi:hypothetical protein
MMLQRLRPLALLVMLSAHAYAGQPADRPSGNPVETTFQASADEIANPERGMYVWAADNLAAWPQTAHRLAPAATRCPRRCLPT